MQKRRPRSRETEASRAGSGDSCGELQTRPDKIYTKRGDYVSLYARQTFQQLAPTPAGGGH
jgi:hypothetical protein